MAPAQPPLPTAWNLPFQPDDGNHTSILMSESGEGTSVATTRQKAGRVAKRAAFGPLGVSRGDWKLPAGTCSANVTTVFAAANLSSPWQAVSAAMPVAGSSAMRIPATSARRVVMSLLQSDCTRGREPNPEESIAFQYCRLNGRILHAS